MLNKAKKPSVTLETLSTKIDALAESLDDLARVTKHKTERGSATIRDNIVRCDTFDDIAIRLEYLKKMSVKV